MRLIICIRRRRSPAQKRSTILPPTQTEVRDAQYTMENYTTPLYLQGLETVEAIEIMKEQLDVALDEF